VHLQIHLLGNNKTNLILNVFKISLIIFVFVSLLATFEPFYRGVDSYLYGINAINLAEGNWGFTNDLLKETGSTDFVPLQFVKTIDNTAVPIGGHGIYAISAISYLIAGYYGLFYLGPIFTVALLIISERIATNLFGKYVGLVTLILLSSNATIFYIGQRLLTDNIFALFLILGCFFLAKFLQSRKEKLIIFSSIFFALSAAMKLTGMIFLPIEVSLLSIYFLISIIRQAKKDKVLNKNSPLLKPLTQKIKSKKFLRCSIFLFIPWMIFFLFMINYNAYYFGDPFTDYKKEMPPGPGLEDSKLSFFKFDADRFEWIKYFAVPTIPDVIQPNSLKSNLLEPIRISDVPSENWVGLLSISALIAALVVSLYYKNKRAEVIIFIFFIIGLWLIYSSSNLHSTNYEESREWLELRDRYMIPTMALSFILMGFILHQIWKRTISQILRNQHKIILKSFKTVFLVSMIILSILALIESPPISIIPASNSDFNFNDPEYLKNLYQKDYLLNKQLPKDSVILTRWAVPAFELDYIPFYPYWGYYPTYRTAWIPDLLPQEPIQRLKNMLSEQHELDEEFNIVSFSGPRDDNPRHDIFVHKSKNFHDSLYYGYLESEHGIILKDYTKSFCKMELIQNVDKTKNISSDEVCYPRP